MVQRTCLNCGETWLLDAREAHQKPGQVISQAFRFRANVRDEVRWPEAREQGPDEQLEEVRELRTCPECGSDDYKDKPQPRGTPSPD
jgi:predicted nucleic-acid-binding Zn-ribbon protein